MTIFLQLANRVIAELTPFQQQGGEQNVNQQAGQITLVWVVAIVLLLGLLAITFKKSKRTHLY